MPIARSLKNPYKLNSTMFHSQEVVLRGDESIIKECLALNRTIVTVCFHLYAWYFKLHS